MPTRFSAEQLEGDRRLPDGTRERIWAFNYVFEPGRIHCFQGPEGGGKGLLWRLLALLEKPRGGEVWVGDCATSRLPEEDLCELRNREIGYVFPIPYLLPGFTVIENVAMPLFKILGADPADARHATEEVLAMTGLAELGNETPVNLSPFEQQIAALARAAVHRPSLLAIEWPGLAPREMLRFLDACRRLVDHFCATAVVTVPSDYETGWGDAVLAVNGGIVRGSGNVPRQQ